MTIYLFGDSYVEAEPAKHLNVPDHKRWYDMLSENCNENHLNLGKCGSGPIEALEKFHDMYENNAFDKNDKFVFVLSSPYRIPWKWKLTDYGPKEPASNIYQDFFSLDNGANLNFSDEQLYALGCFYDCMSEELARENIKNIYHLKMISLQRNWKMVVFTVYDMNSNPQEKIYNKFAYDLEFINDHNFYYYETPLYEHSKKEWDNSSKFDEGLINHFSEKNHVIISNIITNHFIGTTYPTKFHEKHIKDVFNNEQRFMEVRTKLTEFIYE